ncbi:hypothetical protein BDN71DRAFT_1438114 [Pleurotus eryngii]|uniref:Uncharacterized protein n=1 Tax=Pleurotus eryngii TaxID=5323 RepID=A0A9P6AA73_PLEER|nr:hypothetical protein BDN71DRAFT_1438114 [Pleurotus eryngii]
MASSSSLVAAPSLSKLSLSSDSGSSQANHIDLTLDDDDAYHDPYGQKRYAKRPRIERTDSMQSSAMSFPPANNFRSSPTNHGGFASSNAHSGYAAEPNGNRVAQSSSHISPNGSPFYQPYTPMSATATVSPFYAAQQRQEVHNPVRNSMSMPAIPSALSPRPLAPAVSDPQVIDLTNSPSPPPSHPLHANTPLPDDLSPKTPVCIGQVHANALVLSPIAYVIAPNGQENEWASVRLRYEPPSPDKKETIQIRTLDVKAANGELLPGEMFGVVEQKATCVVGPMLYKGLIRIEAQVRKVARPLPILPLQMLVCTPKGNIPHVAKFFADCRLMLDHPSPSFDLLHVSKYPYFNPHNPPPGGFNQAFLNKLGYGSVNNVGRWGSPSVAAKSVEVQRSQVEELFKSMKDGDELVETDATSDVATKLYPHQKKALTFLLDREHEKPAGNEFASLWRKEMDPMSGHLVWIHVVTKEQVYQEPKESKGSILADDMGLGKTITCVSLIAATLSASRAFAAEPLTPVAPPSGHMAPDASEFAGSVWGMPENNGASSSKAQAKAARNQEKKDSEYARACRIKVRSRATLILCPLSTVSNWEDQFKDHWKGDVTIVGGSSGCAPPPLPSASSGSSTPSQSTPQFGQNESKAQVHSGSSLRVYIYHGNARRPDPAFLSDFDAVITTYATLASEYSKQSKSLANADAEDEDDDGPSSDCGGVDVDDNGNQILRLPKPKKSGLKRKKRCTANATETSSALQSVHWFRVVLDEAHCIKETSTVGSRASCDLVADRRLCLTGTPVQNKLDDVFALIKFLRLTPFDDKTAWTQYIGGPAKFGQPLGIARLQTIMKFVTLRRTKETRTPDGQKVLSLPPRRDELRYLRFDEQEKAIYDQFFHQSQAEFQEMTDKNEVMKNYVGILQRILRLRQICDHLELVQNKSSDSSASYEDIVAAISKEGINPARAAAIFSMLRDSSTAQCVECGTELCSATYLAQAETAEAENGSTVKRGRKPKGAQSRVPTRQNSPTNPQPVLSRCLHLFCIECYRNSICPGWPNVPPQTTRSCSACQTSLNPQDAVEIKPDSLNIDAPSASTKKKSTKREKRQKATLESFHPSTKIKALMQDLLGFSRANPNSANYDHSSIEVQMIDQQGNCVDEGGIKTVVFSQWTSMLDKIEDALEMAGIKYDRLDGTMKREDRSRAMDALKFDPACEVLLVSLKAGGVGLNLTAAQRVYLMDPYWNPAVENQAVDRIHRLGQTRPVTTIRFIIENSIEARLLEVQAKKTKLADVTLGQNGFSKSEILARRMEDLTKLLS